MKNNLVSMLLAVTMVSAPVVSVQADDPKPEGGADAEAVTASETSVETGSEESVKAAEAAAEEASAEKEAAQQNYENADAACQEAENQANAAGQSAQDAISQAVSDAGSEADAAGNDCADAETARDAASQELESRTADAEKADQEMQQADREVSDAKTPEDVTQSDVDGAAAEADAAKAELEKATADAAASDAASRQAEEAVKQAEQEKNTQNNSVSQDEQALSTASDEAGKKAEAADQADSAAQKAEAEKTATEQETSSLPSASEAEKAEAEAGKQAETASSDHQTASAALDDAKASVTEADKANEAALQALEKAGTAKANAEKAVSKAEEDVKTAQSASDQAKAAYDKAISERDDLMKGSPEEEAVRKADEAVKEAGAQYAKSKSVLEDAQAKLTAAQTKEQEAEQKQALAVAAAADAAKKAEEARDQYSAANGGATVDRDIEDTKKQLADTEEAKDAAEKASAENRTNTEQAEKDAAVAADEEKKAVNPAKLADYDLKYAQEAEDRAATDLKLANAVNGTVYFVNYDENGKPEVVLPDEVKAKDFRFVLEGEDGSHIVVSRNLDYDQTDSLRYDPETGKFQVIYGIWVPFKGGKGCGDYVTSYEEALELIKRKKEEGSTRKYDHFTLESQEGYVYYNATWTDQNGTPHEQLYRINVVNYGDQQYDQQHEEAFRKIVDQIITPGMTDMEKVEAIAKYVAGNYDYGPNASSACSMYDSGSGDCWASADMVTQLAKLAGLNAWIRNGNRDSQSAGIGHLDAMVKCGGTAYVVDAGYDGKKEYRPYTITEEKSEFSVRWDGVTVYQYDGRDTDVTIPEEITALDDYVFWSRLWKEDDVKSVHVPATTTKISDHAFSSAYSITQIDVDRNNPNYKSEGGALLSKDGKTLLAVPWGLSHYRVPDSVETISDNAFGYQKTDNRAGLYPNISTGTQIIEGRSGSVAEKWVKAHESEGYVFIATDSDTYETDLAEAIYQYQHRNASDVEKQRIKMYTEQISKLSEEELKPIREAARAAYQKAAEFAKSVAAIAQDKENALETAKKNASDSQARLASLKASQTDLDQKAKDAGDLIGTLTKKLGSLMEVQKQLASLNQAADDADAKLANEQTALDVIRNSTKAEQEAVKAAQAAADSDKKVVAAAQDAFCRAAQAKADKAEAIVRNLKDTADEAAKKLTKAKETLSEKQEEEKAASAAFDKAQSDQKEAEDRLTKAEKALSESESAYRNTASALEEAKTAYEAAKATNDANKAARAKLENLRKAYESAAAAKAEADADLEDAKHAEKDAENALAKARSAAEEAETKLAERRSDAEKASEAAKAARMKADESKRVYAEKLAASQKAGQAYQRILAAEERAKKASEKYDAAVKAKENAASALNQAETVLKQKQDVLEKARKKLAKASGIRYEDALKADIEDPDFAYLNESIRKVRAAQEAYQNALTAKAEAAVQLDSSSKAAAEAEKRYQVLKTAYNAIQQAGQSSQTDPGKDNGKTEDSSDTERPSDTVKPSDTEEPTDTKRPTDTVKPSETEKSSDTNNQSETERPTDTVKPSDTEEPTDTKRPTDTVKPSETEKPSDTEEPSDTERPTDTVKPSETEKPSDTTKPSGMVKPVDTVKSSANASARIPGQTVRPDIKNSDAHSGNAVSRSEEVSDTSVAKGSAPVRTNVGTAVREAVTLESLIGQYSNTAVQAYLQLPVSKSDVDGVHYSAMKAELAKCDADSITIKWKKVPDAVNYIVLGATEDGHYEVIGNTRGLSFRNGNLKPGTIYRYVVLAVNQNGQLLEIGKSVHAVTSGGTEENAETISVAEGQTEVKMRSGEKFELKAAIEDSDGDGSESDVRELMSEVTDENVVTVDEAGSLNAIGSGMTEVIFYAQDGRAEVVRVSVE